MWSVSICTQPSCSTVSEIVSRSPAAGSGEVRRCASSASARTAARLNGPGTAWLMRGSCNCGRLAAHYHNSTNVLSESTRFFTRTRVARTAHLGYDCLAFHEARRPHEDGNVIQATPHHPADRYPCSTRHSVCEDRKSVV